IVLGIFAYRLLAVAALPAVDFPTISIQGQLPGASAETMAASVAAPIERQLSTIAGITSLTSSSSLGITSITIQFELNRNIGGAHRCRAQAAGGNDDAAQLPQGESGRLPDHVYQPGLADLAFIGRRRIWRDHAGTTDFADSRRCPGAGVRRAEICRAGAGRSR